MERKRYTDGHVGGMDRGVLGGRPLVADNSVRGAWEQGANVQKLIA